MCSIRFFVSLAMRGRKGLHFPENIPPRLIFMSKKSYSYFKKNHYADFDTNSSLDGIYYIIKVMCLKPSWQFFWNNMNTSWNFFSQTNLNSKGFCVFTEEFSKEKAIFYLYIKSESTFFGSKCLNSFGFVSLNCERQISAHIGPILKTS